MEQISSAEIADIMIRADCYLTVTEITILAKEKYPHLHVSRVSVTNIIRHFVRSSRAICELDDRVYPRKYWLHGLNGYQFKVRGRTLNTAVYWLKTVAGNQSNRREKSNESWWTWRISCGMPPLKSVVLLYESG